eukprot:GHVN01049451.1.p1 GENE.GHVN01049451.1~~GHVN01049451.1.p1  ORF type:complete len:185 (-),score=24.32 GHVN01049451.1:199-693(-)
MVTQFNQNAQRHRIGDVDSFDSLSKQLDEHRASNNLFFSIKVDGKFKHLSLRTAKRSLNGDHILKAMKQQSEFIETDVEGTLVGFWCPHYSSHIGIPGYHLHFITADRKRGGHVLNLLADGGLSAQVQMESRFSLVLPKHENFCRADFSEDPSAALEIVERSRG